MYMDAVMKDENRREQRLPGILYPDDLVFFGELKHDLKMMVEYFVEVLSSSLKVYADNIKVMV